MHINIYLIACRRWPTLLSVLNHSVWLFVDVRKIAVAEIISTRLSHADLYTVETLAERRRGQRSRHRGAVRGAVRGFCPYGDSQQIATKPLLIINLYYSCRSSLAHASLTLCTATGRTSSDRRQPPPRTHCLQPERTSHRPLPPAAVRRRGKRAHQPRSK